MIRLSHVDVTEAAVRRVEKLLRAGVVGQSDVVVEFERAFARWVGSDYAVAVSSGTMADTIALAVLKNFYPDKKNVLVPALTFIAQVNAISYNGLNPIFMDRFEKPTRFSPADVLCYFPVHLLGKPAMGVPPGEFPTIEDSCEAMGSAIGGKRCGTIGDMGTFSFFPSHTITTGEGGMIVTNNKRYADLARRLRNHGKVDNASFHFDVIGFNGKMTSIQAALGIEALKTIDAVIRQRRKNFAFLGGLEGKGELISPHAFPVICKSQGARDILMRRLTESGIECRNFFSSIPTQEAAYSHMGHRLGQFPYAEEVGARGLYVPCHQGLSPDDLHKIKEIINEKETKTTSEVLMHVN